MFNTLDSKTQEILRFPFHFFVEFQTKQVHCRQGSVGVLLEIWLAAGTETQKSSHPGGLMKNLGLSQKTANTNYENDPGKNSNSYHP